MCRHHSKVDNSSTTVNFCDIPEDGGDGKSSQWEELWAMPLAIYFAWKEKQLKMQLYTNSWAVATGLAAWLGTWKKHYWKIGVKEICSRGIQVGPSKWAKMWRYLYLMWLLTKEWPRQTRIVIIKWIRWPSFVTVNLFLQLPLPLPNGLMNKETMVSWVKNMHGLSTMVFPWPQTTWLWTLLSVQSATDVAPLAWSPSYLVAGWLLGLFPSWTGRHFVLTGIHTCSGCRFAFPACSVSSKTTICGLTESLMHRHGTAHCIVSDQEMHFRAKEMQQWAMVIEFTGLTMFPPFWRLSCIAI